MNKKNMTGRGAGIGIGATLAVLVLVGILAFGGPDTTGVEGDTLASVETQAGEEAPVCNYPQEWIGRTLNEDAVKEYARVYRILRGKTAMTMDYSAERLNIETDEDGLVTKVWCG